MLKKLLSPVVLFTLAGLVFLLAIVRMVVDVDVPSRPVAGIEVLDTLKERDDLNVVFLVVDTLRADRLSTYGYERPTSPTLDDIASSGIRFANVEAQSSWTKTSMASLWTGLFPSTNGILRHPHAIPEAQKMPAEILEEAGFTTLGIWRNGWVANNFGFQQGFDLYFRPPPNRARQQVAPPNPSAHRLMGSDFDLTEAAVELAEGHRNERFLLYVHYMDVHQYVFESESALFGTGFSDAYDNAIHWTDRNINYLLAHMDEHGLLEKSIVVIVSDHGEAFMEHGMEGHGRNLYPEQVQTPFLIMLPARLDKEVVVETRVANVDVWPTVLDLLGLPPLPNAEGRSLVPLIKAAYHGEEAPAEFEQRLAFGHIDQSWGRSSQEPTPLVGVSRGSMRLYRFPLHPDRPLELYDRTSDPGEQENLADEQPEVADELAAEVDRYMENELPAGSPDVRELDEFRLNQLRALGYVVR